MCFEPRGQHAGARAAQLTAGSGTGAGAAKPSEPPEGRISSVFRFQVAQQV